MTTVDSATLNSLWHDADAREVRLREIITERLTDKPPPLHGDFVVTTYNTYKKQNAVGRDVNLYGRCFDKMETAVERLRKS